MVQTRLKLRVRSSLEAVVGAISGTLQPPDRLILGLPDADGVLRVIGTTGPLKPGQRQEVAALLEPMTGEHPWPENVPTAGDVIWAGKDRLPVTRVNPTLVVEVEADAAYEHHFRHQAHYLRARTDLLPDELNPM